MQTNTRHLPATAPMHPSILSSSQYPHNPYNLSQDTPKTTRPRIIQGYNSSPGHSPKTTHSRNTGQDSLLRQLIPGQHRAGLSKIIRPKTYQQDIWCFRTIGPRTAIITQLVPRHINKIYGVSGQPVPGQESLHTEFYQDSFQQGQVLYIHAILRSVCSNLLIRIILQEY